MPCYCDIPDENDQIEIERRCKVMMFFDACHISGNDFIPGPDINEDLCLLCKILTEDQMKKVLAIYDKIKWNHKNLYDWYIQHCIDDINNNMQHQNLELDEEEKELSDYLDKWCDDPKNQGRIKDIRDRIDRKLKEMEKDK